MQGLWTKIITCDIPRHTTTYYSSLHKTDKLQYQKKFYVYFCLTKICMQFIAPIYLDSVEACTITYFTLVIKIYFNIIFY